MIVGQAHALDDVISLVRQCCVCYTVRGVKLSLARVGRDIGKLYPGKNDLHVRSWRTTWALQTNGGRAERYR